MNEVETLGFAIALLLAMASGMTLGTFGILWTDRRAAKRDNIVRRMGSK